MRLDIERMNTFDLISINLLPNRTKLTIYKTEEEDIIIFYRWDTDRRVWVPRKLDISIPKDPFWDGPE